MKTAHRVLIVVGFFAAPPANAQEPTLPDLSGTWVERQVTTSVSNVAIVGDIETKATAYIKVDIQQSGPNLVLNETVCAIRLDPQYDQVRPILPNKLLVAMGKRKRVGLLTKDEKGVVNFRQQTSLDVLGANLKRPWKDKLPTSLDDPRLYDQDKDGKPGVTIKTEGLIEADIYFAQRNWTTLIGTLEGNTISGTVLWRTQQNILDATSIFLTDAPGARSHPSPLKNRFSMVKVEEDLTCTALMKNRKRWFSQ